MAIGKNDVEALMDEQVVNEIFKDVERESKVFSLFRRLPNMTSDKTKLKVASALPTVYFVSETTNNGRKNLSEMAWKNVYLTAEELAVIIPIKENLLNDVNVDLWAEIKPELVKAVARKVDDAVFNGVDAPVSWGNGIIPTIIAKSKNITESDDLYSDINDVMSAVEESGFNVNALLGGVGLKSKFRMLRDKNGQPLNTTEIGSLRREFMDNGAWDKTKATLIAGDFNQAVYAIRQDVTYKILDQAIIQDPTDGSIKYNLPQEDMVALRMTFRMRICYSKPCNKPRRNRNTISILSISTRRNSKFII